MNEIDLLEIGSYTELQGGNIVLPKGYSAILEPLEQVIPKKNLLRKHPVKHIKWNCRKRGQVFIKNVINFVLSNRKLENNFFTPHNLKLVSFAEN